MSSEVAQKPAAAEAGPTDPMAALRSRRYLGLLALAAVLGVPISAVAYWFLALVGALQRWAFTSIPHGLGFATPPLWWPLIPLVVAGAIVGVVVRYVPGHGGESPVDGFHAGAAPGPTAMSGVAAAAVAAIGLGVVVGPEAPLIALGGGLAVLAVRLGRRGDVPARMASVVAATGSFAAVSTLFGSPRAGAFLMMEATGLGGATATVVLVPGLLGAGIGSLVFLVAAKGLAYSGALAAFRGGPTFPAMFLGAVGGTALAHLPGLDALAGAAIGMGAMTVGMLRPPMSSVLLATLFLGSTGLTVIPLVIVGVVASYVVTLRLPDPTPAT